MSGPADTDAALQARLAEAAALRRAGRQAEAIHVYKAVLAVRPDLADHWFDLAWMLRREGRPVEALGAYARALENGVTGAEEVHLNRAVILSDDLRREAEAEAELEAALRIAPDYRPALANLGNLREERGDRDGAADAYRRLLAIREGASDTAALTLAVEARARLIHLDPPPTARDPRLAALAADADRAGLDAETRANAAFARARALDRLGEPEAAFQAAELANRLARASGAAYSAERDGQLTRALANAFPAPAPVRPADGAGRAPVFICGLFRSGSTLLEQILSAHPAITAGGELPYLPRLAARLQPFPAAAARLGDADAAALADAYRTQLRAAFPEAVASGQTITDKRPDNYLFIGLIKRLFPDARIIDTVRHPLDTGLSVWFQHIDQRAMPWTSDLDAIGRHTVEYRRVMAHWRALYPDDIAAFDYDAFVADPEPELRRLLGFLGLDWHADCLRPEKRQNTVKTASYWQVRQPLYRSSSGRWRAYAAHLEPLRKALEAGGVTIPET